MSEGKTPNLPEIQKLLGNFSASSVEMWLRMQQLPYSAIGREELAKRVLSAITEDKLTLAAFIDGLIGIEEARAKTIYLVKANDDNFVRTLNKQVADLKVDLTSSRILAKVKSTTPGLIYAINNSKYFRMKWGESQTQVTVNRRKAEMEKKPVPVLFVFHLDKQTGIGQLRYESPEMIHSHKQNGEAKQQLYFDFYREKCENMTGLSFDPIDLRGRLRELLLKQPPVVVPVTMSTIGEDLQTVVYGSRSSADPRSLKDFKADMQADAQPRTFEKAPVRWQYQMTNYKLYRNLWSQIDGAAGVVRFDADCTEGEVEYVISQLV